MVAPLVAAAAIDAAANIGSGFLPQGGGRDDDAWWLAVQQYEEQKKQYQENVKMQYEFAQNGVQWRVADAAKAGISPLAALGATGASFSPVSSGPVSYNPPESRENRFAGPLRNMGQDISRAVAAAQTADERKAMALDLQRRQTENDLAEVNLANAKWELANKVGPPMPGGQFSKEVAPGFTVMRQGPDELKILPSEEFTRQTFNLPMQGWSWQLNNKLLPMFTGRKPKAMPAVIDYEGAKYYYDRGRYIRR